MLVSRSINTAPAFQEGRAQTTRSPPSYLPAVEAMAGLSSTADRGRRLRQLLRYVTGSKQIGFVHVIGSSRGFSTKNDFKYFLLLYFSIDLLLLYFHWLIVKKNIKLIYLLLYFSIYTRIYLAKDFSDARDIFANY